MPVVAEITKEQWYEYLVHLTHYASRLFNYYGWSGKNPSFQGKSPEDIAQDAIVDVIEGTRPYDEDKGLDFLVFLKGIVRSEVNHLATSAGAAKQRYFFVSEADCSISEELMVEGDEPDPPLICVSRELIEKLKNRLKEEADPMVYKILECLENEITKPQDMAIVLGISVKEIYNIQKRFRRTVENMKDIKKEYCS